MLVFRPPEHRPDAQLWLGDVMSTCPCPVIVPPVGYCDELPAWQK